MIRAPPPRVSRAECDWRLAIGESNRRDVTDAHGIANARA